jgi:hypothetical protein
MKEEQIDQQLEIEAIDLGDIDVLEEDVTPMTCCGLGCSC